MMNDEMNARVIGFKFHVSSLMMTCIRVYLSTCVLANLSTCLLVYLSTCLLVYLFTDLLHRLENAVQENIHVSIFGILWHEFAED